jgi:hypothetical protein
MNIKNLSLLAASLIFFCALQRAEGAETVTLITQATQAGVKAYSSTVTLNAGDSAQIVYTNPSSFGVAEITKDAMTFSVGMMLSATMVQPTIAGPATIRAEADPNIVSLNTPVVVTLVITRANVPPSQTPQNTVVIPENATGNVQIILESSTDMITWTAATPGSYGSSTQRRFFRIRAVGQ